MLQLVVSMRIFMAIQCTVQIIDGLGNRDISNRPRVLLAVLMSFSSNFVAQAVKMRKIRNRYSIMSFDGEFLK